MSTSESRRAKSGISSKARPPSAHDELLTVGNRVVRCRIRKEPGGGYMVACQGPVRRVFGKTLEEARTNAREMITLWFDALDEAERRPLQSHDSN
jgi:predicted RNase H-like HicB family nuclease